MIGIVFISDVEYCPYLKKYTEILESSNEKFEVLFWNREKKKKDYPTNYKPFIYESEKNRLPVFKVFDFLKYRKWLKNKINSRKYTKLIILSTLSGMIISDVLIQDFKGKYIFDIRDYSYEYNSLFYNIEKKIIKGSYFTCISSNGFKVFLPRGLNYLTVHNFNKNDLQNKKDFKKKDLGDKLSVVFIGGVRYFDHQMKLIDKLKNDSRFEMVYHGAGIELERFIAYCQDNDIKNILFTGEYDNKDKNLLLKDADILNNSYKSKKFIEVKYAISNKYYDGLVYGIPQLVETKTYKQSIVENLGLGIGIDEDDMDFSNKLYEYYFNVEEKNFNKSCNRELKNIIVEDSNFSDAITKFIES